MKKGYLGLMVALLIVASTTVFAQPATIGIYADLEGTMNVVQGYAAMPEGPFDLYVIVFWESVVGGASYSLDDASIPPDVMMGPITYVPSIQVGNPFDGCGVEVGFNMPTPGWFDAPVLVSTLNFINTGDPVDMTLCVMPHCQYGEAVVANAEAAIYIADAQCLVIPNEAETWGSVKDLYR